MNLLTNLQKNYGSTKNCYLLRQKSLFLYSFTFWVGIPRYRKRCFEWKSEVGSGRPTYKFVILYPSLTAPKSRNLLCVSSNLSNKENIRVYLRIYDEGKLLIRTHRQWCVLNMEDVGVRVASFPRKVRKAWRGSARARGLAQRQTVIVGLSSDFRWRKEEAEGRGVLQTVAAYAQLTQAHNFPGLVVIC